MPSLSRLKALLRNLAADARQTGDVDTIVSIDIHSRPFTDQVETANLTVLDGIGHMPQHTSQPEVLAAIDRAATRAGLR